MRRATGNAAFPRYLMPDLRPCYNTPEVPPSRLILVPVT